MKTTAQPARRARTIEGGRGGRAESRHLALVGDADGEATGVHARRASAPPRVGGAALLVVTLGALAFAAALATVLSLVVPAGVPGR